MRNPLVIRSWTSYFNDILGIPCRFLCCWADFASQAICEALLTTIPLLSHDSPKYIHSHPTIPRSLIHRLNPPQIYLKPTYQDVADLASPTPALQPETTKAVSLSQNSETPCIYETKINPIKIKGEVVGLACFSRNITEKRNIVYIFGNYV